MQDSTKQIQPISALIIRLWHHVGAQRQKQFLLVLGLMVMTAFFEIISIGSVLPFLGVLTQPDKIFKHPFAQPVVQFLSLTSAEQLLFPLIIIFILAALMAGTMRMMLLWASTRYSFAVGSDISLAIYRRTLYQPYEVHIARNSAEVINGIWGKVSEVTFHIIIAAMTLVSGCVMVIGLTLALLIVIPGMALGVFGGFTVIYALIILLTRKRLKNYSQLIARESNNVIKSIQEGLYGIRDVLIDGSQESFCNIYNNTNHVLRYTQGNNQLISQGPRYAVDVLAMVLVAILAYVLSKQAGGMGEAIPVLAALALGMQRLLPFLQQVYGSVSTIHGAQASLQDVLGFLDQPLPDHAEDSEIQSISFCEQIQLRGVSFRYTQQSPWVFNNVNLNIAKGARIGFIGATGCGKSTLLDIIMGLLQPTEGVLEIDNQPVTMANTRLWQKHIAHVPQSVFLADCSIEENIAFGVPRNEIDSVRVHQAAEQAQIADVIEALPQKYHTFVGERGVQLSGGQRQRLGIARALYKRADVIIFDEATSALDSETELAVMNAIEALSENITVLIIAHRQNTLRNCTEIFELGKNGISSSEIHY